VSRGGWEPAANIPSYRTCRQGVPIGLRDSGVLLVLLTCACTSRGPSWRFTDDGIAAASSMLHVFHGRGR
jgi:hypothetical protein